jgi:hypothetical protein
MALGVSTGRAGVPEVHTETQATPKIARSSPRYIGQHAAARGQKHQHKTGRRGRAVQQRAVCTTYASQGTTHPHDDEQAPTTEIHTREHPHPNTPTNTHTEKHTTHTIPATLAGPPSSAPGDPTVDVVWVTGWKAAAHSSHVSGALRGTGGLSRVAATASADWHTADSAPPVPSRCGAQASMERGGGRRKHTQKFLKYSGWRVRPTRWLATHTDTQRDTH